MEAKGSHKPNVGPGRWTRRQTRRRLGRLALCLLSSLFLVLTSLPLTVLVPPFPFTTAATVRAAAGDPDLPDSMASNVVTPACVAPPSGLVSWWPGDGHAGDITGSNPGTLQGGATFAVGKVGQAFSFDGVDDFVDLGTGSSFRQSSAITYSFWVNIPPGGGGHAMGVGAQGGHGLGGVSVNATAFQFMWTPTNPIWDTFISAQGVPTDQWMHLAVAVDFVNQTRAMYLNGQPLATTVTNNQNLPLVDWVPNGSYNAGLSDAIGGRYVNVFSPFKGQLDEVGVFNRALSAAEIQAMYNAGSAGTCKAAKLAVTTVSPATPAPGQTFAVTVQSRSANATVEAVSQDTTVTLAKKPGSGSGLLQGTPAGTIPAGQSSVTITGMTFSQPETGVVLTATATSGDTLAAGDSGSFDVIDPGTFQFGAAAFSVNEGSGTATITVTRTGSSAVSVGYATSDGTATAGADYTTTSGTLSWALGEVAAKTFTIPIGEDAIYEDNETVNLTLNNPTGGATLGAQSTAVLTIVENDPAPATKLAITDVNNAVNPVAGQPFSVTVQAQDGTGAPANVVQATAINLSVKTGVGTLSGTLTWTISAGESSVTINRVFSSQAEQGVVLRADDDPNPNETAETGLLPGESAAFTIGIGPSFGVNLLQNPGNESALVSGQIPNWTEVVASSWTKRSSSPSPFEGGAYFFPGANASAELRQDVDVSAFAGTITAGTQRFAFDGRVRSYPQSPADTSRIVVEYRNADRSAVLDSFDSGPIANTFAWQLVADARTVPAGTRWVRVRLVSTRHNGTNNDGYYDALALRALPVPTGLAITGVSPTSPNPAPATFSVTVGSRDASGMVANVTQDTTVTLTKKTGTGTLGGNVTGTILTGTSSVTISGVTFSQAETGVVLTASATSGDALAAGDSPALQVAPAGLVSWWAGEGNASDSQDGNHGTLQGGVSFATGKVDQAFSLDGVDDYIQVSSGANLRIAGSWTLGAWVKTPGSATSMGVVRKITQPGGGPRIDNYFLDLRGDGGTVMAGFSPAAEDFRQWRGTRPVTDNLFHHIAATYNSATGTMTIYVDGTADTATQFLGAAPTPGTVPATDDTPVTIGLDPYGSGGAGLYFKGLMDEVGVFNRALTAAEIQAIFSAGSAGGPIKLAISSIDPAGPTAGQAFSVVVQSQDSAGAATPVTQNTTVSLSRKTGTGTLEGTLTGTIPAGQSSVTISGVIYSVPETGVVLTANATAGDTLMAGDSAAFNVVAPITLVFTGQPAKAAHTFAFGIPPVVEVQQAGGTLGTDTRVVTLRIKPGTGAAGATLTCAGGLDQAAGAGVATFADCRIDLKGTGYVLEASATGALAAETQAFDVTWAGDANGDCLVDIVDFSVLVRSFGKQLGDAGFDARADLNGDNRVDILDFSVLVTGFGTRCPL